MIPFDFEYYRPNTLLEAQETFLDLEKQGKSPLYYGGGTEIISMARMNNIKTGAVIDIKEIPECRVLALDKNNLVVGAAMTLTQIHESNLFPLLAQAAARVADHTIQNKITLGGNICGSIIYREALLPLLLADSQVVVSTPAGEHILPINQVYNNRLLLGKGEFIVQFLVPLEFLAAPHFHIKRTKVDKIDYPLLTICALQINNQVRIALSGLCNYPFRSVEMETELNKPAMSIEQRVENAIDMVPGVILNDIHGSAEYRKFVLKIWLINILQTWED